MRNENCGCKKNNWGFCKHTPNHIHNHVARVVSYLYVLVWYHLCLCSLTIKDNTIPVYRLVMWPICAFLGMLWGGGKGYSASVRANTQPDRLLVRYDSVICTYRISLALNSFCIPSMVIKVLFCQWDCFISR